MGIHLKSYNKLKKESGLLDSYVELIELSLRNLPDDKNQILDISKSLGININESVVDKRKNDLKKIYIILPISSLDSFITNIRGELLQFYDYKYKDKDNESKLDGLIRNINEIKKFSFNQYCYDVLKYYFEIRNSISHPSSFQKNLDKIIQKIDSKSIPPEYKKYKSNFNVNNIDFNDFILCTVIVKYLAYEICNHINPNLDTIYNAYKKEDVEIEKNIKYLELNKTRHRNSLKMILKEKYCLNNDEVEKLLNMTD